jgi:endosialidase-like protein
LLFNGNSNTANGVNALYSDTSGSFNTANGRGALLKNSTASYNTADGYQALNNNNTGQDNTATGASALFTNTAGSSNTAIGVSALYLSTGSNNTAIGFSALSSSTGSNNITLGFNAGLNLTTGDNDIDIGTFGGSGDSGIIRIGTAGSQTRAFVAGIYNVDEGGTIKPVYINSNGQLGTQAPASSRRFKKEIKPMNQTSEAILGLKPVTFQYKSDTKGTPQFGLIAEEVAKVNPDLVVRDENGEIYTVRYDAVNAMLLNEFLKEHRTVEGQQKEIDALKAELKEQKALIQKVSDQIEAAKPAPQMVVND